MKLRIKRVRGAKWVRERGKRSLSMLPHVFTLTNLTLGMFAIIVAVSDDLVRAALLILAALVADGLDGRVARWVRSDGEFGKELDSLADVVSFGAAPAVVMYQTVLWQYGPYGWALAALFPVCGALRLARFNIVKTSGFFIGLPITAAGSILATLVLYTRGSVAAHWIFPALVLVLSYLMISNIPYPDFKQRRGQQDRSPALWPWLVPVGLVAWALAQDYRTLIFLPLATYAFLGPYLHALQQWSHRVQPWLRAIAERRGG